MARKKYSQEKESLKNLSEKISAPIGTIKINIWKTISSKLKPFIKKIKQNPDLDEVTKEELLSFIYLTINNDVKNYIPTNIPTWINMVQEFLESKCNASWANYMNNYLGIFDERMKTTVEKTRPKNKKVEEKKTEEKKDEFTELKNSVLKSLGYVQGKRGSQDNSTEKWMLANTGEGVSKTVRGFWINDVQKISNIGALNAFLRKNRLIIKDGHLLRGK